MKYIDVEKLKAEIDKLESFSCISEEQDGFYSAISRINDIIDSLQQEQDLIVINKKDWEMQEQFRKNKVFGKSLQQEQPEVDLEEEVRKCCGSSFRFNYDELNDSFYSNAFEFDDVVELARHFYELGLNARKEESK